ncbi:hypothetical protein QQS21_007649 [Conoideocrella luteorostrata]|uniref:Uncharacterized protein n=1 Tax=Conoideocrella luteorostrata TaxID=1105319 RepID=A0AAJ0FX81_9HYPO|nr:hypothetical protein QQS21_007649 [Conoideocrella luteorostrata]
MPFKRSRLYVGLYVRGGSPKMPGKEDTYHWALLTGPQTDPKLGCRHVMYHVKERLVVEGEPRVARRVWEYTTEFDRTPMLLVRIAIAKVSNIHRLERALQKVPLCPDKEGWNCVEWVREAIQLASRERGALGPTITDWSAIRDKTMWYVDQKKAAHRYDGLGLRADLARTATWDMLVDRELIN